MKKLALGVAALVLLLSPVGATAITHHNAQTSHSNIDWD